MFVTVEWPDTSPILVTTYQGKLTLKEYRAMREQQRAMLADAPDEVVLLADMRAFDGFPDADTIEPDASLLAQPQITGAVIVLDDELYDGLARAFLPANETRRVSFITDLNTALAHAAARLRGA